MEYIGFMTTPNSEELVCCPKFEPSVLDNKTHQWENKPFIKETMRTFLHMPWPPAIGRLMEKMWKIAKDNDAYPAPVDFLMLAYDPTPWRCEYYMAVTKEVPGAENVKMSGTFMSKVFEGPYSAVPKWIKEMNKYVETAGKKVKKHYFYYTTCPKCAKKNGHNYVVAFTEVE